MVVLVAGAGRAVPLEGTPANTLHGSRPAGVPDDTNAGGAPLVDHPWVPLSRPP